MRVPPIDAMKSLSDITTIGSTSGSSHASAGVEFKDVVTKAIKDVNHLQTQADSAAVKVASGDIEDVHQAMIAMQKAKLALDFTIQVRNKVIEAYQGIMQMQV